LPRYYELVAKVKSLTKKQINLNGNKNQIAKTWT